MGGHKYPAREAWVRQRDTTLGERGECVPKEEHERTHSGQVDTFKQTNSSILFANIFFLTQKRPFVCLVCNKSYFRDSHLQAHARSHLPEESRPFPCLFPNCSKRFWTAQHLKRHCDVHTGEKPFKLGRLSCQK